jgi:hypothetical protein
MFSRILGVVQVLLVGTLTLSLTALVLEERAVADTLQTGSGGTKCCRPAHAETPVAPPGSGSACTVVLGYPHTCDNNGNCTAVAWQDAVQGICRPGTALCVEPPDSGRTTLVTIRRGGWTCVIDDPYSDVPTCTCTWVGYERASDLQNVTVGNCTGGPCS